MIHLITTTIYKSLNKSVDVLASKREKRDSITEPITDQYFFMDDDNPVVNHIYEHFFY